MHSQMGDKMRPTATHVVWFVCVSLGNENVPKIMMNDTINSFFKLQLALS